MSRKKEGDPNDLYWDNTGRIECLDHAPLRGSDTWIQDQWTRVTVEARNEWQKKHSSPMSCEGCDSGEGQGLRRTNAASHPA